MNIEFYKKILKEVIDLAGKRNDRFLVEKYLIEMAPICKEELEKLEEKCIWTRHPLNPECMAITQCKNKNVLIDKSDGDFKICPYCGKLIELKW